VHRTNLREPASGTRLLPLANMMVTRSGFRGKLVTVILPAAIMATEA
jgi:hypothetical protein